VATPDRVAALGEQLIHVHQALRDRLAALRQEAAGAAVPEDLLSHCLSFCAAIHESHFSYEERRIAKALDILGPQAWTADVFTMAPRLSGPLIWPAEVPVRFRAPMGRAACFPGG
jgi:hypothetical protein